MTAELPPLSPKMQADLDQFYAGMNEMLDRYIDGIALDMRRHAVKHGPMPDDRAVYDLARIFTKQINDGDLTIPALSGLAALSIVRFVRGRK